LAGRRVFITGMGIIAPNGIGLTSYWDALREGRSGIGRISSFDPGDFSSQIAGEVLDFDPVQYMDRKDAKRMDRFCQFAVAATKMALEDAGLEIDGTRGDRTGVLIGSGVGGTLTWEEQHRILLEKGPSRVSPFFIPMMIADMASGMVSILFGARGPNFAVVSACATSTHAIGEAAKAIARGDADCMIAGGSEAAVSPMSIAGFCAARALSTRNDEPARASRPFDKDRDGFIVGEGCGLVILESEEHVAGRGGQAAAEVVGYGATADAYHITAPAPDGDGAVRSMRAAIQDAGLFPSDIDYINAHGTSTPPNDRTETMAIKVVFGERAREIPISSTKSMIGHLLGAAGAAELIAAALAIEHGVIHPTINYETPDPECDLDYVPNEARPASVGCAMSNSFGFGGHNATLVIKRP
jgi:3-oxoacyl-[acyl-carrier-protein] synthase II